MTFHKKVAKVTLSPVKVHPDLKFSVIAVSNQLEKNYTDTMTYLLQAGINAHLQKKVADFNNPVELGVLGNAPLKATVEKKSKKAAVKRFVAPTVEEVFAHMFAINDSTKIAQDEAEKFHNYWSDMDWKRKSTKMKDWKGSASNWLKNNYGSSTAANRQGAVDQSGFLNNNNPGKIIAGEVVPQQAGFLTHESE